MAPKSAHWLTIPAAAVLLLWPAIWNRYPIVFADTGTYLSQAIERYAGWDRPIFYSLAIFPLHATRSLWPIVAAQALLTAWLLQRICRMAAPALGPAGFLLLVTGLAVGTWLPWLVSEVMPDLLTSLLVLVLWALAWLPERLATREALLFASLATFMIATQQSSLPLSLAVIGVATALRWRRRVVRVRPAASPVSASLFVTTYHCVRTALVPTVFVMAGLVPAIHGLRWLTGRKGVDGRHKAGQDGEQHVERRPSRSPPCNTRSPAYGIRSLSPGPALAAGLSPLLAVIALCSVNLVAHGRFAVSPFGNVFLLARVLYDGPGMEALQRDCPEAGWRLCAFRDRMPESSDAFLWTGDSPLNLAGGPKQVSAEANAIIHAGLRADPLGAAAAALRNAVAQMVHFASGDGLSPWPDQVTPIITADFPPAEAVRYAAARQQTGALVVPPSLSALHSLVAVGGVLFCLLLLPGAWRRKNRAVGLLIVVLVALPVSAAVTGALSGPHDRYQSRLMWLPAFVAPLVLAARRPTSR